MLGFVAVDPPYFDVVAGLAPVGALLVVVQSLAEQSSMVQVSAAGSRR